VPRYVESIYFSKPLSKLVGTSGIDTANGDSEHERTLSRHVDEAGNRPGRAIRDGRYDLVPRAFGNSLMWREPHSGQSNSILPSARSATFGRFSRRTTLRVSGHRVPNTEWTML
jgi:hypothetical protein